MTNEYRLVTFCDQTGKYFPSQAGDISRLDIDFLSAVPELADAMDGWEPVSFQLVPNGELTYLSILMKLPHDVPESL